MAILYKQHPKWTKPSNYRAKGWTDTVQGYLNEARDLTTCILANRQLSGIPYSWLVGVNIECELEPEAHRSLWKKVSASLRRGGVVALWVREPSRSNHVNYHLIVKNPIPWQTLHALLKTAIYVKNHVWIRPVETEFHYAYYLSKAKIGGYLKAGSGEASSKVQPWVADKYARKRLLFKPNTKLKKYGVIGAFWEKSKAAILDGIVERNVRIGAELRRDGVLDLVEYAVDYLGVSKSEARRHLGYWSEAPGIRRWIDQLRESGVIPTPTTNTGMSVSPSYER